MCYVIKYPRYILSWFIKVIQSINNTIILYIFQWYFEQTYFFFLVTWINSTTRVNCFSPAFSCNTKLFVKLVQTTLEFNEQTSYLYWLCPTIDSVPCVGNLWQCLTPFLPTFWAVIIVCAIKILLQSSNYLWCQTPNTNCFQVQEDILKSQIRS